MKSPLNITNQYPCRLNDPLLVDKQELILSESSSRDSVDSFLFVEPLSRIMNDEINENNIVRMAMNRWFFFQLHFLFENNEFLLLFIAISSKKTFYFSLSVPYQLIASTLSTALFPMIKRQIFQFRKKQSQFLCEFLYIFS